MSEKRIVSLIMAGLILASSAACAQQSDIESESESQSVTTESEGVESEVPDNPRLLISDNLGEHDFDGISFRIAGVHLEDVWVEGVTGDVCNDALYNRNAKVGDRFNCNIEIAEEADLKQSVAAGTKDFEVISITDYQVCEANVGENLLDWTEVPNIDFDQPWYNKLANDNFTINDILYTVCSDLSLTAMTYSYGIFFNTELMNNYQYSEETMYDLVRSGEWTFDKMSGMVESMYQDENGDGKKDEDDFYGFAYEITNPADVWFFAFGETVTKKNSDGELVLSFMSEKTVDIYNKLLDFHYNNPGFCSYSEIYLEERYFHDSKVAMAPLRFHAAYNVLRDMEEEYSIVPYPKWDEAQQKYYTCADDKFAVFGIPTTAYDDLDFVGVIFEALSAESYKTVFPAYFDEALKKKYASSVETGEMIDIIMNGRNFDFSFQYGITIFQRLPYFIRDNLKSNKAFTSSYDKLEKVIRNSLEKTILPMYED